MTSVNSIDRHVGGRLKSLREAHGLSIQGLAQALDLPVDGLARLEAGEERIPAMLLRRICQTLRAAPSDFFSGLTPRLQGGKEESEAARTADQAACLLSDFSRIGDETTRKLILAFVASHAAFGQRTGD